MNVVRYSRMICSCLSLLSLPVSAESFAQRCTPQAQACVREAQHALGLVELDGTFYAVHELATLEREGRLTSDEQRTALAQVERMFTKMSEPYMHYANTPTTKANLLKIVESWCAQRDRSESLLTRWASTDITEPMAFSKNIPNMQVLETFLLDLELFLKDLIRSLPKTVGKKLPKLYERLEKERHENPTTHFVISDQRITIVDCVHTVDVAGVVGFIAHIGQLLKGCSPQQFEKLMAQGILPA